MTALWVALGGALGALLRYLGVAGVMRAFGGGFPYGTLAVNVIGSLVMGVGAAIILEKTGGGRLWAFLMTGVCGGFTTFSAFSLDAVFLMERGRGLAAAAYVGGSVAASIGALALGLWFGRAMIGAGA